MDRVKRQTDIHTRKKEREKLSDDTHRGKTYTEMQMKVGVEQKFYFRRKKEKKWVMQRRPKEEVDDDCDDELFKRWQLDVANN